MDSEFIAKLNSICKNILTNEPMSRHTTFKIGGPADFLVSAASIGELTNITKLCGNFNVPCTIIGNGSNLLVSDLGIEGVVIKTSFDKIEVCGCEIQAGAGALLSRFARSALDAELTGLEFAAGIPGTVGGAIYMNAGAYGGEMKDITESVTYIDEDNAIKTISKNDLSFGYRKSFFTGKKCIIVSCIAKLNHGSYDEIKAKMTELSAKRTEKQPLSMPSAGSTFKRPEGYFAGSLIEQAGLKGYSIGGAAVSEKHAGFIVNKGGATCTDVIKLIKHIQNTVKEKFSVELEPEIKITGRVAK